MTCNESKAEGEEALGFDADAIKVHHARELKVVARF